MNGRPSAPALVWAASLSPSYAVQPIRIKTGSRMERIARMNPPPRVARPIALAPRRRECNPASTNAVTVLLSGAVGLIVTSAQAESRRGDAAVAVHVALLQRRGMKNPFRLVGCLFLVAAIPAVAVPPPVRVGISVLDLQPDGDLRAS